MKLLQLVLEILDKPTPFQITKNTEKAFWAKSTINGRIIAFKFGKWAGANKWAFSFVQLGDDEDEFDEGTFDATGSGKELEVFATAKAFLEAAIKEKKPDVVYFEASKTEGPSRAKLYKKFTSRWSPPGYKHRIVNADKDTDYHAYIQNDFYREIYGDKK